jgi:hypothetical protein
MRFGQDRGPLVIANGTRKVATAALSSMAVFILLMASSAAVASPLGIGGSVREASNGSAHHLLASCALGMFPAYADIDASNGYIYVANSGNLGGGSISVIQPPCTEIATIIPPPLPDYPATPVGVVYDPLTHEIVVPDGDNGVAWVIQGLSIVTTINLGGFGEQLGQGAWDSSVGSVLIPDAVTGVDVIHLTLVHGATKVSVRVAAFDNKLNGPTNLLVADGYVFSAGQAVDIFSASTFLPEGQFAFPPGGLNSLTSIAWEPQTRQAVLGELSTNTPQAVIFLDAGSIATHKFTFHLLKARDILQGGATGVAYSPDDRSLYMSADLGSDVWILGPTGALDHVYVPHSQGLGADVIYDPSSHSVYAVGYRSNTLYELI